MCEEVITEHSLKSFKRAWNLQCCHSNKISDRLNQVLPGLIRVQRCFFLYHKVLNNKRSFFPTFFFKSHRPNNNTTFTFKLILYSAFCSLTVPNLQITKGLCGRNIVVFMPDFDKTAVGLRNQTTKAQPSPLFSGT